MQSFYQEKAKGITICIVREIILSDFAFMRFMSNNMLTTEESQHKDEIIDLTEQVLHAKGLESDNRISKLSEEELREILKKVKMLRSNNRRRKIDDHDNLTDDESSKKKYYCCR